MPTTPTTAFALGSKESPLTMYLADLFSVQANVAGVPALSFPYGKDDRNLPIGLQAMALDFQEGRLLQFAKALQVDQ
jgi:aspartyl-tRNA(Asn)/glutamyl-tRNA(Gln) amidotransferase subunit A